MARSIMDVVQENVNPVSVSNALYEIMLDWRSCAMMIQSGQADSKRRMRYKMAIIERYMAWFLQVDGSEMRRLLRAHFDIKGKV